MIMNKLFKAIARNIPCSPYKLRPIVDAIRNKSVFYALNWLSVYNNQRVKPIKKVIESALSNLLYQQQVDPKMRDRVITEAIVINEIKVDQGPIKKYFRPGAQGRATILRKRYAHIFVTVQSASGKLDFSDIKMPVSQAAVVQKN
jgi:large subunit ribosomal protein L22